MNRRFLLTLLIVFNLSSQAQRMIIHQKLGTMSFNTALIDSVTFDINDSDKQIYDNPEISENYIIVGEDGDFASVVEGFEYARSHSIPTVIIKPGVYDLIKEGIKDYGLVVPECVWGYGATLLCEPNQKDWKLSALYIDPLSNKTEIYGLTVVCSNCRYNIHDDMGGVICGINIFLRI